MRDGARDPGSRYGGGVDASRIDVVGAALVDAALVARHPWPNGGGTTRTLWAEPLSAQWEWRLSVADIIDESAFSHLPQVRRSFTPLDGAVELVVGEHRQRLAALSTAEFDGAVRTTARPLHGPTRALNVMTRPTYRAHVSTRQVAGGLSWESDVRAVVVLDGTIELAGKKLSAEQSVFWPTGQPPGHCAGDALVAVVRIHPNPSKEQG